MNKDGSNIKEMQKRNYLGTVSSVTPVEGGGGEGVKPVVRVWPPQNLDICNDIM